MSKIYKCDICGRFDFTPEELKTVVITKHKEKEDFLIHFDYERDVLIKDICPVCLNKLVEHINEIKEVQNENN